MTAVTQRDIGTIKDAATREPNLQNLPEVVGMAVKKIHDFMNSCSKHFQIANMGGGG